MRAAQVSLRGGGGVVDAQPQAHRGRGRRGVLGGRRAKGEIIVEGPFALNRAFLDMLSGATGRTILTSASSTGTSIGPALLATGTDSRFKLASKETATPSGIYRKRLEQWRDRWLQKTNI